MRGFGPGLGASMRAVDTNVLVRLIVRDDSGSGQVEKAEAFVAQGAWVSQLVLAETVWVLEFVYGRTDDFEAESRLEVELGYGVGAPRASHRAPPKAQRRGQASNDARRQVTPPTGRPCAILAINLEDRVSLVLVEQNSRMALRVSSRACAPGIPGMRWSQPELGTQSGFRLPEQRAGSRISLCPDSPTATTGSGRAQETGRESLGQATSIKSSNSA